MARYTIKFQAVLDTEAANGRWIVPDPSSADYQEYLAWVALGNVPDPAYPVPSTIGDTNYKALIRRRAERLVKQGKPLDALNLLKTTGA